MLTPRERLQTALNHQEPDRIPLDLGGIVTGITKGCNKELMEHLGFEGEEKIIDRVQQLVKPEEELLQRLGVDTRYVYLPACEEVQGSELRGGVWKDEWGVERRKAAYYYDIVKSPFRGATLEDIVTADWPDPHIAGRYEGLTENVKRVDKESDYPIIINAIGSVFEFAWYLCGYDYFMRNLISNPSIPCALMDKMLEFQIGFFEEILDRTGRFVDVVLCGDDIAIQRGPAISPKLYRKYVKPRQKKLYSIIKNKTEAKLFYHSCGGVYPLVKDLIEIGVDILNPVQVSADGMDTEKLKRRYGSELTFWGGIDTQHILPHGEPKDVEREVKKRIDDLAPGGGYVLNSVHNLQPDVPPENVITMFKTGRSYGVY